MVLKKRLYVLGILGSPKRKGNLERLLDLALAGAAGEGARTEKLVLNELKITPCQECYGCLQGGVCVLQDDMTVLYQKLLDFDRVVLSSPVFFLGVSAQVKAMMDRCQAFWAKKYILKEKLISPARARLGMFLATAGSDKPHIFDPSVRMVKAFFATLETKYWGGFLYGGIESRDIWAPESKIPEEVRRAGADLVLGRANEHPSVEEVVKH